LSVVNYTQLTPPRHRRELNDAHFSPPAQHSPHIAELDRCDGRKFFGWFGSVHRYWLAKAAPRIGGWRAHTDSSASRRADDHFVVADDARRSAVHRRGTRDAAHTRRRVASR